MKNYESIEIKEVNNLKERVDLMSDCTYMQKLLNKIQPLNPDMTENREILADLLQAVSFALRNTNVKEPVLKDYTVEIQLDELEVEPVESIVSDAEEI